MCSDGGEKEGEGKERREGVQQGASGRLNTRDAPPFRASRWIINHFRRRGEFEKLAEEDRLAPSEGILLRPGRKQIHTAWPPVS